MVEFPPLSAVLGGLFAPRTTNSPCRCGGTSLAWVYLVLRVHGQIEEDEIPSERLPEPSDLIADEDVFPEDRIEAGESPRSFRW